MNDEQTELLKAILTEFKELNQTLKGIKNNTSHGGYH
jgi:hypothetical protein